MAVTARQKFAIKLLFWLLPWPISRALPRSLRIYYWGPTGEPPGGWYDYWGIPGFYWPDPDIPIDPDLFPDLPDDPFNPGDLVNPPDPESFPDLPDGPTNPSDPFTPGPTSDGIGASSQGLKGTGWMSYTGDAYWIEPVDAEFDSNQCSWKSLGADFELAIKTAWTDGWRPTQIRITHNCAILDFELLDSNSDNIASAGNYISGTPVDITFGDYDIKWLYLNARLNEKILKIEFFGEIAIIDNVEGSTC